MPGKLEYFTTSKMDHRLLRQKVHQRISGIPENWHFYSRLVLKTTRTVVFFEITEFFDKLLDVRNDDPFLTL